MGYMLERIDAFVDYVSESKKRIFLYMTGWLVLVLGSPLASEILPPTFRIGFFVPLLLLVFGGAVIFLLVESKYQEKQILTDFKERLTDTSLTAEEQEQVRSIAEKSVRTALAPKWAKPE